MTTKNSIKIMIAAAYLKRIRNPDKYERFAHSYLISKYAWAFLSLMLFCNVCCFGQNITDIMPYRDTALTVGVIIKQNTIDTVLCLVAVMNTETSKFDTTVLYSLKQLFKWQQKGGNSNKPHYYYKIIGYLDADKNQISKNIVVIKEIEWL
jgi:hypothetical protein